MNSKAIIILLPALLSSIVVAIPAEEAADRSLLESRSGKAFSEKFNVVVAVHVDNSWEDEFNSKTEIDNYIKESVAQTEKYFKKTYKLQSDITFLIPKITHYSQRWKFNAATWSNVKQMSLDSKMDAHIFLYMTRDKYYPGKYHHTGRICSPGKDERTVFVVGRLDGWPSKEGTPQYLENAKTIARLFGMHANYGSCAEENAILTANNKAKTTWSECNRVHYAKFMKSHIGKECVQTSCYDRKWRECGFFANWPGTCPWNYYQCMKTCQGC